MGPACLPNCLMIVYLRIPGHLSAMHKRIGETVLLGCCTLRTICPELFVGMSICLNGAGIEWPSARGCIERYSSSSTISQTNAAVAARNEKLQTSGGSL